MKARVTRLLKYILKYITGLVIATARTLGRGRLSVPLATSSTFIASLRCFLIILQDLLH